MKQLSAIGVTVLMMAGMAACDVEDQETDTAPAAAEMDVEDRMPEDDFGAESDVVIDVDSLEEAGAYITDREGRALYVLEGEPEGESTCYDDCAREWPPLLAQQGEPRAADEAVAEDQLGTIERRDGQRQVTLDGQPLYYYHDDEGPGDTAGHHVTDEWGEWYLVQPDGELLEGHGEGMDGESMEGSS